MMYRPVGYDQMDTVETPQVRVILFKTEKEKVLEAEIGTIRLRTDPTKTSVVWAYLYYDGEGESIAFQTTGGEGCRYRDIKTLLPFWQNVDEIDLRHEVGEFLEDFAMENGHRQEGGKLLRGMHRYHMHQLSAPQTITSQSNQQNLVNGMPESDIWHTVKQTASDADKLEVALKHRDVDQILIELIKTDTFDHLSATVITVIYKILAQKLGTASCPPPHILHNVRSKIGKLFQIPTRNVCDTQEWKDAAVEADLTREVFEAATGYNQQLVYVDSAMANIVDNREVISGFDSRTIRNEDFENVSTDDDTE